MFEALERRLLLIAGLAIDTSPLAEAKGGGVFVEIRNDRQSRIEVSVVQSGGEKITSWVRNQSYPPLIDLRAPDDPFLTRTPHYSNDGSFGFAVLGEVRHGFLGSNFLVGDVNGDGFDDILDRDISDDANAYLFLGQSDTQDQSSQDADFVFGFDPSKETAWSSGDFNADGLMDVALSFTDRGFDSEARTQIVYGGEDFVSRLQSAVTSIDLCGETGTLVFHDRTEEGARFHAMSAGDINGDGTDDLVVPLKTIDPEFQEYGVVFGAEHPSAVYDFAGLDREEGFVFSYERIFPVDFLGEFATVGVGDINGDGFDDLFHGQSKSFIYGSDEFDEVVVVNDLVSDRFEDVLKVFSAGDLNGDGFGDVFMEPSDPTAAHTIRFGGVDGITSTVVEIVGSEVRRLFGNQVDSADVNADGLDDLVITSANADTTFGQPDFVPGPGLAFVIFGAPSYPSTINLDQLGTQGVIVEGIGLGSLFGTDVESGDVNGDGVQDILFGAPNMETPQGTDAGAIHAILGMQERTTGEDVLDSTVSIPVGNSVTFSIETSGSIAIDVLLSDGSRETLQLTDAATLPGDANGDRSTNFQDFLILANNFGNEDAAFADGDFDGDGRVSFLDFLVLAENFGRTIA